MARRKTPSSAHPESARHEHGLPALKPLRVLVAGEVILDRYFWGDVSRISPEAPIPILRVQRREEKPGNAGFVMANLRALGADVSALSVVGSDRNGSLLREIFADLGIDTRSILIDPDRPTIVKDRMLGSVQAANRATQQLLRVDEEDPRPLKPPRERELIARLKSELRNCDGVLISDIDKGMLTPAVLRALIDGGRARGIPVIVDPRRTDDFSIYRGATALTPNRHETEVATGMRLTDRGAWRKAAETLVRKLGLEACLITLDRDGMYLAERGGKDTYVSTTPREVYDVTGAGDVVLSVFGMFSIAGLGFSSAATIANLAASIEVTRIGTEVITREDLARALSPAHASYERKIHSAEELQGCARARAPRRPPDRIHQRMLRPAARRAYPESRVCARAGRRAGGRSQQRSQRAAAQGRRAPGLSRGGARANPGRTRSGRLRSRVRGNARRENYSRGQARRFDQRRGLARQTGRWPGVRRVARRASRTRAAAGRSLHYRDDRSDEFYADREEKRRVI